MWKKLWLHLECSTTNCCSLIQHAIPKVAWSYWKESWQAAERSRCRNRLEKEHLPSTTQKISSKIQPALWRTGSLTLTYSISLPATNNLGITELSDLAVQLLRSFQNESHPFSAPYIWLQSASLCALCIFSFLESSGRGNYCGRDFFWPIICWDYEFEFRQGRGFCALWVLFVVQ
jgi:hypothetical protein